MDKKARSTIEMNDPASRPAIAKMPDVGAYDRIYVGFPIWWYVAPRIINPFLEACELDGKTVIPFATSGGSGMGKTNSVLKPSCGGAKLVEGKVFRKKCFQGRPRRMGGERLILKKSQGHLTLAFQLCCFFPSLTFRRTMADSTRTIPAALIGVSASL